MKVKSKHLSLLLTKQMIDKVNYLHQAFPSTEWSGPAWYSTSQSKKSNIPDKWKLVHFVPIDLGTGTSTEFDGKDQTKIIQEEMKKRPQLSKCCVGLIHSHHNMGAYHSGTDNETLEELAPANGFFGSLVVSHAKEHYAFAISYLSQHKHGIIIESDNVIVDKPKIKVDKEFIKTVNNLKEQEKVKPAQQIITWGNNTSYYNHASSYYNNIIGGINAEKQDKLLDISDKFVMGDINVYQARAKFTLMNENFDSFFEEHFDEPVQTNKEGKYLNVTDVGY